VQLPGEYASPGGVILLLLGETRVAGTASLRPAGDGAAELRRVYVRPDERGRGYGRVLVNEALARARRAGYTHVQLETLDAMSEAIALYESLGFALMGAEDGVRRYGKVTA
jgi:putative acetyltransferase